MSASGQGGASGCQVPSWQISSGRGDHGQTRRSAPTFNLSISQSFNLRITALFDPRLPPTCLLSLSLGRRGSPTGGGRVAGAQRIRTEQQDTTISLVYTGFRAFPAAGNHLLRRSVFPNHCPPGGTLGLVARIPRHSAKYPAYRRHILEINESGNLSTPNLKNNLCQIANLN